MEPGFFEIVRDAFEGFARGVDGRQNIHVHSRGIKVWFGDESREHYESQLIHIDGEQRLEIGFHAEHLKALQNDAVLQRLLDAEPTWRPDLGDDAVAGDFIDRAGWRRISEVWPAPAATAGEPAIDEAIEVAARLADYVIVLELVRRTVST
jgi:hypothetical protein